MSIKQTLGKLWPWKNQSHELCRLRDGDGVVSLYEHGQFRTLVFDDSFYEQGRVHKQNPLHLEHDYIRAMLLPVLHYSPDAITVLGLGTGSLASWLHHHLPKAQLTVVELRASVISIARDYLQLPEDERLQVVKQSAAAYLAACTARSCDLLLSDLYHAYQADDAQSDENFYRDCRRVLKNNGWLVVNHNKLPAPAFPPLRLLCDQFASVFTLNVDNANWILFATPAQVTRQEVLQWPTPGWLPGDMAGSFNKFRQKLVKVN